VIGTGLCSAADFAAAVSDDEAQARSLAPIQIGDFANKHDLTPLADEATRRHVWIIVREQATSDVAARGGTNGHVLLAQVLEPLLRRAKGHEIVRLLDGMAEAGLFDRDSTPS